MSWKFIRMISNIILVKFIVCYVVIELFELNEVLQVIIAIVFAILVFLYILQFESEENKI